MEKPRRVAPRGPYVPRPEPDNVVRLLDLAEIKEFWGVWPERVFRAVARGRLRAYGRPGQRKYYSMAEVVKLFGEPSSSVIGRQLSWIELGDDILSA